jgi:uncharacterized RDD family membrane protein YckC
MSVTLDEDDIVPGLMADGRPDPAYAASLGIVHAGLGRRAASFAIDASVFIVLLLPVLIGAVPLILGMVAENPDPASWPASPDFVTAAIFYLVSQGLVSVFTIVQLALHGLTGRTVGKSILGIRSVNVATFGKPGFWRIVLRALVLSAAFTLVPYLGVIPFLLSPLWDAEKRGRGWHDRIGRNWLIDVRRGLDPFDAKALRHARRALTAPVIPEGQDLPSLATGTAWGGPAFVPSARSSSGVISHGGDDPVEEKWNAPELGARPVVAAAAPNPAAPVVANPAPPGPSIAAPRPTSAVFLVFDNGLTLEVKGNGLLGRNPEPRPGESAEHLYLIDDPDRQLSKTHLGFGIDASGVWIEDRGSSNGTFVRTASGAVLALEAMKKTRIAPDVVVEIGDRTFRVRQDT